MSYPTVNPWRDMPEGREKYNAYLCSPEWGRLREAVKRRSRGVCERCSYFPLDHVHHVTYERKYQERLDDLRALCKGCHEFEHGRRLRDPILDTPVKLFGHTIESVYLAGPITGNSWRDEFFDNPKSGGVNTLADWNSDEWSFIATPDGRQLEFTGPYWCDVGIGHSAPTDVPHAVAYGSAKAHAGSGYDIREYVVEKCVISVRRSDLFFAWLPHGECHGTLVELGIARQICRAVVVAIPPTFNFRDVWFPLAVATCVIRAETPGEAWKMLWSGSGAGYVDLVEDWMDADQQHYGEPDYEGHGEAA